MRVILLLMVRNEAAIVARCIASALPVINAALVCDTGSEDRCVEVAHDALDGVTHRLVRQTWRDFGHNRTLSFKACVDFCTDLGWDLAETYCLLLDADMTLEVHGALELAGPAILAHATQRRFELPQYPPDKAGSAGYLPGHDPRVLGCEQQAPDDALHCGRERWGVQAGQIPTRSGPPPAKPARGA